jgi:hypothetical protein
MNCDNHKPDITTYSKEYYKNNKAYFKEYYKKYRDNNQAYYTDYSKEYYKNNNAYFKEYYKKYYQLSLTCEGIIKINKAPITLYFN